MVRQVQTFLSALSLILSISTLLSVFIVIALLITKNRIGAGAEPNMHEFDFVIRHSKNAVVINLYMIMVGGIYKRINYCNRQYACFTSFKKSR